MGNRMAQDAMMMDLSQIHYILLEIYRSWASKFESKVSIKN